MAIVLKNVNMADNVKSLLRQKKQNNKAAAEAPLMPEPRADIEDFSGFDQYLDEAAEAYVETEASTTAAEYSEQQPDETATVAKNDLQVVDDGLMYLGQKYIPVDIVDSEVESRILQAQNSMDEAMQEARERGHQEGLASGEEQGLKQYEEKRLALNELLVSINHAYESKVMENETLIVEAIFAAVAKVMGDELGQENGRVALIKNVFNQIKSNRPHLIKVAPADYTLLENDDSMYLNDVKIEADDRIESGGCIIETEKGTFDGRLEVQLARLRDTLMV